MEKFGVSERRACELNAVDRSSYRYEPRPDRNTRLREKLTELARHKPRYGYRRLGVLLEREGEAVNHKRLWRVYQQAGLGVRRRERKRLERGKAGMPILSRPNQEWSIDFVNDALANGRAIRALTVIDGFTKESPVIEVDTSLSAPRITRALDGQSSNEDSQTVCAWTTARSLRAAVSWRGPNSAESGSCSFSPASLSRTALSRASTAVSGTSV